MDEKPGRIYLTRVSLGENTIMVDGALPQLLPGVAATAEISTGRRRLIEFSSLRSCVPSGKA